MLSLDPQYAPRIASTSKLDSIHGQEARRATGRPAGMQVAWGLLYDTPIASMVALPSLYLNDREYTYESFRPIQFPPGTDLRRKCIVSLLYRIPLTPQVAGINNTDQIEKRFTAPVFRQGTNRNRNRESLSGGGTLGRRNERYQRVSYDWPTKRADGQRAEIRTCTSVAFSGFQGGRRGSNFRGLLQRKNDTSLLRDEICKIRAGQSECLHIIRPLALNRFRMAQDAVSGQGFRLPPPLAGGRGLRVRSGVASAPDGDMVGPLPWSG